MTRREFLLAAPAAVSAAGCLGLDPRLLTEPRVDTAPLADANTAFAFDLFDQLRRRPGNIFFSPFCVATSLSLAAAGADGATRSELLHALHRGDESDPRAAGDAALQRQIAASVAPSGCELRSAYALWTDRGLPVHEDFRKLAQDRYAGALQSADFGRPDAALRSINGWTEYHTAFKIKNLLTAELPPQTRLLLSSAVYFRGVWARTFPKATGTYGAFHAPAGQLTAPYMRQTAEYFLAENDHAQVIEIPFAGGSLRWLMVVPRQPDGLPAVETGFNPELLRRFDDQRSMQRVLLAMPRLRAATETKLKQPLQALGVNRAFQAPDADWSRLTGQPGLALDSIVHKAIVEVSEEGADSATATSQAVRSAVAARDGEAKPLAVDRPFLVVVRDAVSHSVLFLGRIEKP